MTRRITALAVAAVTLVAGTAACSKSSNNTGGNTSKTLVVGVDLPFQGESKDTSDATFNAMQIYLDSVGGKAGNYTVQLKKYDDSTAAAGKWDDATCKKDANDHVANANEVAVMGTYNSGCAKLEVPVLNQDPSGPMLMVSHANTNVGLTRPLDQGEPDKYYPAGKRNYARVITTDDAQGKAAADFMVKELGLKRIAVLNDTETYGQGVAKAFADEVAKAGATLLGNTAWDAKQTSYTALFTNIKSQNPDGVFVGGIYDQNGGQLIKDKVAVLGDNNAVKMMGPDGFTGYPDEDKLPQADGMYYSYPGLAQEQLATAGGAGQKLLDAYKTKYNSTPPSNYVVYGVLALQVILAAIAKSDGTRKSVRDAVFNGDGVTVAAADSVLGKDVKINTQNGDVVTNYLSILQMKNNKETFLKPFSV
jgi:branched-chain amino acid transport system substrate-binding protein